MNQQLSLIVSQTEQLIDNAKYNIKAFSTSNALQSAIRQDYPVTAYGSYLFTSAMKASVDNIMDIPSLVISGYIQTYDGKIYDIKKDNVSYYPTAEQNRRYEDIVERIGQIMVEPPLDNSGKSALRISKSLIDIDNGQCLGILTMDLKEEMFYDVYRDLSQSSSLLFFLTDRNNTVISSQDRSLLQQPLPKFGKIHTSGNDEPQIIEYQNTRYLSMALPVACADMTLYCLFPYSRILTGSISLGALVIFVGIFMILGTIILAELLSRSLTKPLDQLSVYAREVGKGNLEASIALSCEDEIGSLADEFSNSVQNIRSLTQKIYAEQAQKKEYALTLLQAQINPHFLYNCLDNISTLVESGENETADKMIHHLGHYYRGILSKGRNIITISEELDLIRDYMQIQLIRTPELFTYDITVSPEILEYKTLKFLLQPIIENSIIHGFSGYRKKGHINIHGYQNEKGIFLEITDNGKGFHADYPGQILTPADNSFPRHFGLMNIHERLQLKYGPQYGLTVLSIPGRGTTVTVHFPKVP